LLTEKSASRANDICERYNLSSNFRIFFFFGVIKELFSGQRLNTLNQLSTAVKTFLDGSSANVLPTVFQEGIRRSHFAAKDLISDLESVDSEDRSPVLVRDMFVVNRGLQNHRRIWI
jgi:hypothetical protein